MVIRDFRIQRVARNLGVMPVDGEKDGRIAQNAEVEGVVRVLPDVLAADYDILAHGLLESGMELVAEPRLQYSGHARRAGKQRRQHRIRAAVAGDHQVFIERRLQRARIGGAQDGFGRLDVIGNAHARLRLFGDGEAIVDIAANAEVEVPVTGLDLVFNVEGEFLYVGVTEERVIYSAAGQIVRQQERIKGAPGDGSLETRPAPAHCDGFVSPG